MKRRPGPEGLRCNAICPGGIDSGMPLGGTSDQVLDERVARIRSTMQRRGRPAGGEAETLPLERPWLRTWAHLPKRSAGTDFTRADYAAARARAREVARTTLGDALWAQLQRQGYLDVPSKRQPGLIYRLRVGRRIEVRCAPGVRSPWPTPYL